MSLSWTLGLLAATLAVAGHALWRERRPRDIDRPPPLVPPPLLLGLALVAAVALLAHLVSLATGQPLRSRFGGF